MSSGRALAGSQPVFYRAVSALKEKRVGSSEDLTFSNIPRLSAIMQNNKFLNSIL